MADGHITVEVSTQVAQDEVQRLRDQNATLKRDLVYARDGLTKGRTRMREDIARLEAENAALKREAEAAQEWRLVAWVELDGTLVWHDRAAATGRNLYARLGPNVGAMRLDAAGGKSV